MKPSEFLIERDGNQVLCNAIAMFYSEDKSRGFIVYDDGMKSNNKTLLKIAEVVTNSDNEVFIEDLKDKEEFDYIWDNFKKLYDNQSNVN